MVSVTVAAPSSQPPYSVRPGSSERDRDSIRGLWEGGLARGPIQTARWIWLYEANPAGKPQVFLLKTSPSNEIVGTASLSPRQMRIGSREVTAGFLIDFIVDAAHRQFFPALVLQKSLLRASRASAPVIFGTPNARSEAVVRRAGYREVGKVVRMARVVRSRDFLARYIPAWLAAPASLVIDPLLDLRSRLSGPRDARYRCEWCERPDEAFDALWSRIRLPDRLVGVRDRAFLTWRFVDSPYHHHRFVKVLARDGRLAGYGVCRTDGVAMHVTDFLVDPEAQGAFACLWRELARAAYREGLRSLSVTFMGDDETRRSLEGLGMVARAEQPVYAAFDESIGVDLGKPSGWYLTNADEDA